MGFTFSTIIKCIYGLSCNNNNFSIFTVTYLFNKNRFSGELAFGAAIHTGNNEIKDGELGYGCKVNFRELIAFGYDINDTQKIQLSAQHMSNGSLCDPNQGLTSVGLRFAWKLN